MKWLAAILLLFAGDAFAVTQAEQDARVANHGTVVAFTEPTCTGASQPVLTGTQTANGIRMLVRNIDATNAVTLCPGVTCPSATGGITLLASTAAFYVPPIEIQTVRGVTFTCFSGAGTPAIEVWLEKLE